MRDARAQAKLYFIRVPHSRLYRVHFPRVRLRRALRRHLRCKIVRERKCSGFSGTPLSTGTFFWLNVQCFGAFWVATVKLAVKSYIVPDGAMAHEIRLGTDSSGRFSRPRIQRYRRTRNHFDTPNYPARKSFS